MPAGVVTNLRRIVELLRLVDTPGIGGVAVRGIQHHKIDCAALADAPIEWQGIPPGGIFSFNDTVGDVSAANGIEDSLVIWGDQTVGFRFRNNNDSYLLIEPVVDSRYSDRLLLTFGASLQTKFGDRKANKALVIGLKAMPLGKQIEQSHSVAEMGLKIAPAFVRHMLEVADLRKHGKDWFNDHTNIPFTPFTQA